MKIKRKQQERKPWIKICFTAAGVLLVLSLLLYALLYVSVDREFFACQDYFGDSYSELFSLKSANKEARKSIQAQFLQALEFVGAQEELEAFGLLGQYATDQSLFPEGVRGEGSCEFLAGATEKNSGYLWFAYTKQVYNEAGEEIFSKGAEKQRCLVRFTIENQAGVWTVTEIMEQP